MSKPTYLFVVPSSCQMYSGTGTAIYDWIRFAKQAFTFTLLMDTNNSYNCVNASIFCREHGVEFIPSAAVILPGCPDICVWDYPRVTGRKTYDVVETVSWANAATNTLILERIPESSILVYTPHAQPLWTIGDGGTTLAIRSVFRRILDRADIVLVDSMPELKLDLFENHSNNNVYEVPLGVDTDLFINKNQHKAKSILTVCDFREKRKRSDLLFEAFSAALAIDPDLSFTLVGRSSDLVSLPDAIVARTITMGYISTNEILQQFQKAAVFALMSDYEAFGLPIAEALCCGTQVVINYQEATFSLFGELPGVHITNNTDIASTANALVRAAAQTIDPTLVSKSASAKFSLYATYGKKQLLVERMLSAKIGK